MYTHKPGTYKLFYNNTGVSYIYYWKSIIPNTYTVSYWLKNPIDHKCLICQTITVKDTDFRSKIKSIQLECLNKLKEVIEKKYPYFIDADKIRVNKLPNGNDLVYYWKFNKKHMCV